MSALQKSDRAQNRRYSMPKMPSPHPASGVLTILALAALAAVASLGVTALAQAGARAPTAPATGALLAPDARLGAAFAEAFVGPSRTLDPTNAVALPDATHIEVEVKAAHDGERLFVQYTFPTPLPSLFHGASVYRDGAWVRLGQPPVRGPQVDGLYEDKIAMFIDDGSVKGFANQGGWLTCHDDVRGIYGAAARDDIVAHPVLGEKNLTSMPKYLIQSRDTGPQWWDFAGWDAIDPADVGRMTQRFENGVFLDLWSWGSHRTDPVGRADNETVFDYRRADPGAGPSRANWNGQAQQPAFMFDASVTGFAALDWETLQAGAYGPDDPIFLIDGVNAVAFDADREWQEGDVIPAQLLNPNPTESRGSVEADGRLVRQSDGGWVWQVTLSRDFDTGHPAVDKVFKAGRTYDVAVAVHRLATGSRWHYVTLPFTIGIDTPGDVTASRFDGDAPDWSTIPGSTRIAIYPGQTTWQWITSDGHPGGEQIRTDSMSVVGCHDDVGLGAANKQIETYLAGLTPSRNSELVVARAGFDPGNIVFWFVVLAILILGSAVGLGLLRRG
jgi:hypothetical protein